MHLQLKQTGPALHGSTQWLLPYVLSWWHTTCSNWLNSSC